MPSVSGTGQAGGSGIRLGAGKATHRHHEFINLRFLALPNRVCDAVLDVILQKDQADLVDGRLDGGDLGQHVDAVRILGYHAGDSTDLPFDAADALQKRLFVVGITSSHSLTIPWPGIRNSGRELAGD